MCIESGLIFDRANSIADLLCFFVVFLRNRQLHRATQLDQLRLRFSVVGSSLRTLSNMLAGTMNAYEQFLKFYSKVNIIVRAAKSASFAELPKRNVADGALL